MSLNLTREQAIVEHRKMWRWISRETLKRKKQVTKKIYFEEKHIPVAERPFAGCYACEYDGTFEFNYGETQCQNCPLEWGGNADHVMCLHTDNPPQGQLQNLFGRWLAASNWKEAAELARQIAELPERKEE